MTPPSPQPESRTLKWWRRGLITVTAVAAALASFVFLRDLALHVGWPSWAAVLLPLSVDALAAAALTEYRLTGSRAAGSVAVLVIAGSAAGNALSHVYTVGIWEPAPAAVIAVGAVPAVALGLVVHTATKGASWAPQHNGAVPGSPPSSSVSSAGTDATLVPGTAGSAVPNRSVPVPDPVPVRNTSSSRSKPRTTSTATPTPGLPRRSDTELVSVITTNGWQDLSLNQLSSRLKISKRRASDLRRQAQQHTENPEPAEEPEPSPEPTLNGYPVPGEFARTAA